MSIPHSASDYWTVRDHAEALCIERQMAHAPEAVTVQHIIDLNRFCDLADDGEGYDVPPDRMRALKSVGLVRGGKFGWYKTTDLGDLIRAYWFNVSAGEGGA